MSNPKDIQVAAVSLYFLPVETRVPLKFGPETLTYVTCARVKMTVTNHAGETAVGWGETPLSVEWVWPSKLSYSERHEYLKDFTILLVDAWSKFPEWGHPMEIGYAFQETILRDLFNQTNELRGAEVEPMPWLAALVSCSAFDLALHDAYGVLNNKPVYEMYAPPYMNYDLTHYLIPAEDSTVSFKGRYPSDYLVFPSPTKLPAWHVVGGLDPITEADLSGDEPKDGYPILLSDWIKRDGLNCLKVKLCGNDSVWDYERMVQVGEIAIETGVDWLTFDFNCTVTDPEYVNEILDQLLVEHPRIYGMLLYVEQPFPYDLEKHRIDVHSVSARKPLFMDESAHDWKMVELGRALGWSGVALKTCKTQTGAILSTCWAKAHGMTLMVQDLTNPMLAQIPHALLAAHAGTIMGLGTNAMQYYPEASNPEAQIHPGLYRRSNGEIDLSTLSGAGFGYRINEIERELPPAVAVSEKSG